MQKFKVGDTVVCVDSGDALYLKEGSYYTVVRVSESLIEVVNDLNLPTYYCTERFNKLDFDLNTQPWFIYINSEAEFYTALQWLKDKGFIASYLNQTSFEPNLHGGRKVLAIANGHNTSDLQGNLCYVTAGKDYYKNRNRPEIKINFKTVVDTVVYPEVKCKSQRDIKIEGIQTKMRELEKELDNLKGDKS